MRGARHVSHRHGRAAARAYLSAFLPTPACEATLDRIAETLDRGLTTALGAAHAALLQQARVTAEVAAFTLVTEGGASVPAAARIARVPRRRLRDILRADGIDTPVARVRPGGLGRELRRSVAVPATAVAIGTAGLAILPRGATATGPVALIQDADRAVVVSVVTDVEPEQVFPGGQLDVTVAVMNGGVAPARDVVLVSQLPDELRYVDGSASVRVLDPTGGESERRASDPPTGGIEIGAVPAGATAQLDFTTTVADGAPDGAQLPVLSSAQVDGFGRVTSSPAVATVVHRPELELSFTSEPGARVTAGEPITWRVRVRNVGTRAAEDVRVVWRPAVEDAVTDVGTVPAGDEEILTVTVPAPAASGRQLRQRVEVVHAEGDPIASEVITVDVVGAHLADTGVAAGPAAATGAGLVAAGWALLTRAGRRRE